MSVRYDPLLIDALAREIERRWAGAQVWSLGMDPGRSAATVRFADRTALLANLHRAAGHLLAVEDDPLVGDSVRNTHFSELRLSNVRATPDERGITLVLCDTQDTTRAGIALELHTNRWNVLCLDHIEGDVQGGIETEDGWRVTYALWTREIAGRRLGPGERYAPPASTRRGIEREPNLQEWTETLHADPEDLRGSVLRTWAFSSAINIAWLLGEGTPDPAGSYERYLALRQARVAGSAWLSSRRWGPQPYPLPLGDAKALECPSVLDAMARAADAERVAEPAPAHLGATGGKGEPSGRTETEGARLARRLRARQKRARKRLAALSRQLEAAGSAEESREIGQLLLARKIEIARGQRRVSLEGFDGAPREVALDPALDAVANAQRYFAEARRRERARDRLPAEIARSEARLAELTAGLERFEQTGPDDGLWALVGGRPRPSRAERKPAAARQEDRLPYTRLLSGGGLEIRVGRGARDNDDLTFRHSAPDDIWFHASQASGAHVVLRWGRRDENPPKRDLIDAATAAAVHSAGRNSGAVQVVWTRRKYVRKPRKSPPGTVVPDRVRTLMVTPDADLVRRLREAAGPQAF